MDFVKVFNHTKEISLLYIEDEEIVLEQTSSIFEDLFKYVETAKDADEGLEKYKRYKSLNNKYFDVVITDLKLPKMDGFTLAEEINSINVKQAIIAISSSNDSETLKRLINLGVSGFILKPIEADAFMNTLYKVVRNI